MKQLLLLTSVIIALNGCAVVTTVAVVGAAAVSVTSTAVGLTYDVGKTVVKGGYAAGEMAVDAMSSPTPTPPINPNNIRQKSTPNVEVHRLSE